MPIIWTKDWVGADDGTIVGAIDIKNIQDDLSIVQTVNDALSIPSQTQGDILYFNGTDWTRLAAGTAGQVLTTQGAGSNPTFDDATATDLSITSEATGDLLYYDGANWVALAPGTSGDVLTSNGAGVAPTYQTPAVVSAPPGSAIASFMSTVGTATPGDVSSDTADGFTEINDVGSDFVHTTGIFTCPNTGIYLFNVSLRMTLNSASTSTITVTIGGVHATVGILVDTASHNMSGSVILSKTASDTVTVVVATSNIGGTANNIQFSGTLLS